VVRQLAHRAREHVQARRRRYQPDPSAQRAATERFLAAAVGGDLHGLLEVLAPT
jgi:RNA polymerase sigma-70 factor (ECF subfamily)